MSHDPQGDRPQFTPEQIAEFKRGKAKKDRRPKAEKPKGRLIDIRI